MSLMTMHYGSLAAGLWQPQRGTNAADSGSPFYNVYECADGRYVSVAPVELRFFRELLRRLGIDEAEVPDRLDRTSWARTQARIAACFRTRTRATWTALLEGTDCCFAPVLSMPEAAAHPHVAARQALLEIDGVTQPAPAPRFSRTPSARPTPPRAVSREDALQSFGRWVGPQRHAALRSEGLLEAVQGTDTHAAR